MDNTQFKIWISGFYEGDGSIYNDSGNNNRLRLSISQNDRSPLDKAMSIWGGTVCKRVRKSPASDKICIGHEWRIGHDLTIQFLNAIRPYMVVPYMVVPYMVVPYKIRQILEALEKFEIGINRRFKCRFCDEDYSAPSGRRRHEKASHELEIPKIGSAVEEDNYDELVSSLSNLRIESNKLSPDQFQIWMSGFYEAEGTVVNDISNDNKIRMSLAQNDRTPLDLAKDVWNRSIRERI